MTYLYHMVPRNLKGSFLYPLNVLKKKFPEIYEKENKKYVGREVLKKRKIPFLNCLWNDVLHFTAVHPSRFYKELKKVGFPMKKFEWYKIDSKLLDSDKIVIYRYRYGKGDERDFSRFDSKKLINFRKIPKKTIQYYKDRFKKKERPLLFHFVPHILYKGSLDVRSLKKIRM